MLRLSKLQRTTCFVCCICVQVNLAVQETMMDAAVMSEEGMSFDDFQVRAKTVMDAVILSKGGISFDDFLVHLS